jgi:hypothetical protein
LYRDIWYPYGPLEPYVAAGLLWLFGHQLEVLYVFGFAVTVGCAMVVFDIGRMLEGRAIGLAAALLFLSQGFGSTIFNYILPYTYSATLGVLLTLMCAWATLRYALGYPRGNVMLAGLAAGLAVLCKQEMGVAAYALILFVLLEQTVVSRRAEPIIRGVLACLPGLLMVSAIYGWFFWELTPRFVLVDNWQILPSSYFMRTYGARYLAALGLRVVPSEMASIALNALGALVLWCLVAIGYRKVGRGPFGLGVLLIAIVLWIVHWSDPTGRANNVAWYVLLFPRGMFFIGCGFLIYCLSEVRRHAQERLFLAEAALAFLGVLSVTRVFAELRPFDMDIFYTVPLQLTFLIALKKCVAAYADASAMNALLSAEVLLMAIVVFPLGGDAQ